jgi:fatty acid desaturase
MKGEALAPVSRSLTPTEAALADLWRELVSESAVHPGSDFMECGGNSLRAIRLMLRIDEVFGQGVLDPKALFADRTLGGMAANIDAGLRRRAEDLVTKPTAKAPQPLREPERVVRDIRNHLRPLLPSGAFAPDPLKLLWVALHVCVIVAGYRFIAATTTPLAWLLASIVIGHGHVCIGFIAHDLSHGSVVRARRVRYPVELIVWAFNWTPATVWIMNHNRIHHRNTNAPDDSFRYFSESERTPVRTAVATLVNPNRGWKWNPMVGVTQVYLMTVNAIGALLGVQPSIVPNIGRYTRAERLRVAFEFALVGALQVVVFRLAGGHWLKYLFAGPLALLVGSCVASAYLYTQHSLFPLGESNDPLKTTTLQLPRIVDVIHSNVSQHTAHHVFEGMNSNYYPLVTSLLQQHYGSAMSLSRFTECWRRIVCNEKFKANPS